MRDTRTPKLPLMGAAAVLMLGLTACGGGASGLSEQQDALDSLGDFESALSDVEDTDDFDALEDQFAEFGETLECFQEALEYEESQAAPQAAGAMAGGASAPDC